LHGDHRPSPVFSVKESFYACSTWVIKGKGQGDYPLAGVGRAHEISTRKREAELSVLVALPRNRFKGKRTQNFILYYRIKNPV